MKRLSSIIITAIATTSICFGLFYFLGFTEKSEDSTPAQNSRFVNSSATNIDGDVRDALDHLHEQQEILDKKLRALKSGADVPGSFVDAAREVRKTVVNIQAMEPRSPRDWWGGNLSASTGSGVIISDNGYIVTNNHVIDKAVEIKVTLNDKREFTAKMIGVDPTTDMALLKINARNLPSVKIGNSDRLEVGEWVLAVGNPFNLESTVTAGIVSAKARNIDILNNAYSIESFIQTDAVVNPGNSGGALVNTEGELVGINTAIITKTGSYEGYSFAVPANLMVKVTDDLKEFGVVQRGFLGVGIRNVDETTAKVLNLDGRNGVMINEVYAGSGAAEAGLKMGDVILEVDNKRTNSIPELLEYVARKRPGNSVELLIARKSGKTRKTVMLKNNKNNTGLVNKNQVDDSRRLGFELRDLTRREKEKMGVDGARVESITRGSVIDRTNMDPGFVITQVNDERTDDAEEVLKAIRKAKKRVMIAGVYENYEGEYYYGFNK